MMAMDQKDRALERACSLLRITRLPRDTLIGDPIANITKSQLSIKQLSFMYNTQFLRLYDTMLQRATVICCNTSCKYMSIPSRSGN